MRRMYSQGELESLIKKVKTDFTLLVDKDGHERFIEGDIEMETITGFTQTYGKWSLSGTHFMIVLGFDVDNATAMTENLVLAQFTIPKWIYDKIAILWGSSYVLGSSFGFRADNWSLQNFTLALEKVSNNKLRIVYGGSTTSLNANRHARLNFDLLIDNE